MHLHEDSTDGNERILPAGPVIRTATGLDAKYMWISGLEDAAIHADPGNVVAEDDTLFRERLKGIGFYVDAEEHSNPNAAAINENVRELHRRANAPENIRCIAHEIIQQIRILHEGKDSAAVAA